MEQVDLFGGHALSKLKGYQAKSYHKMDFLISNDPFTA